MQVTWGNAGREPVWDEPGQERGSGASIDGPSRGALESGPADDLGV